MSEQAGFGNVALEKYHWLEKIDHVHTAANSSGIVDGAALVLVGSEKAGKANGLTQTQLGNALGVGVSHICMIENGKRGTSVETAVKIKRLTGDAVPIESLLPTAREGAPA